MTANYYEKLTKIFFMSGNALYHAAAWSRYYSVVTSIGGKTDEEMGCKPSSCQHDLKGKNARLTALLGLSRMPTRSGLLKDAVSLFAC